MPRLTKQRIEQSLRAGETVSWKNAAGKLSILQLARLEECRLFAHLLRDPMHDAKVLTDEFIEGLYQAFDGTDAQDTDSLHSPEPSQAAASGALPWKLHAIETEGFGGINTFGGPIFSFVFDSESLLGDGENGSGKSSLTGAIVWAMTGKKPRDQAGDDVHQDEPVVDRSEKAAGSWPPIACYPPTVGALSKPPYVRVKLTFRNASSEEAFVDRSVAAGKMSVVKSDKFLVPEIFIDTGLLMPIRLGQLKFKDGKGQLSQAIQTLTGLNEIAALGSLSAELCHGGRKFLAYAKDQDLPLHRSNFDRALADAAAALAPVNKTMPRFLPIDAESNEGSIALFGKEVADTAAALTRTLQDDLVEGLQLADSTIQQNIVSAIRTATEELEAGLASCDTWRLLRTLDEAMTATDRSAIGQAIEQARLDLAEALALHEQSLVDTKLRLKAVAAGWHRDHAEGPVVDCPLCEERLDPAAGLAAELTRLGEAGVAAQRLLADNVSRLVDRLNKSIPQTLQPLLRTLAMLSPGTALEKDLHGRFAGNAKVNPYLRTFVSLSSDKLTNYPREQEPKAPPQPEPSDAAKATHAIAVAERVLALATWFDAEQSAWNDWWSSFRGPDPSQDRAKELAREDGEGLAQHLGRLAVAMAQAAPYTNASTQLRTAMREGRQVARIEAVQNKRTKITEALAPLKELVALAESVAREAIDELGDKIKEVLNELHAAEKLPFRGTHLHKKDGVVVRAGFTDDVRIDATLIANTSWLRSVLWAYLFALRAEATQQYDGDPFPVMLFDDPQATFDVHHRRRWASYVASLQSGTSRMQVVLLSHDAGFIDAAMAMNLVGRTALLAAATKNVAHLQIFEGDALERRWAEAAETKTAVAAQQYLDDARVYLEGMLKVMLQGEAASVAGETIGDLKRRLQQLRTADRTPWDRPDFETLLGILNGEGGHVGLLEQAHHTTRRELTFAEASAFHKFWKKQLGPCLDKCFRLSREWHAMHGSTNGLHVDPPDAELPEGYEHLLSKFSLPVLGRASAFEGSTASDGRLAYTGIESEAHETVRLGKHWAYRLTARTLEPVASVGDVLLVQQHGAPAARSLVVARWEDRVLARRLELSDSRPDIAVLSAQCVDPLSIAPPLVALRGSLSLHKIIGVLFDSGAALGGAPGHELCDCGGLSMLESRLPTSIGLAEVRGDSAQPIALDGQYLFMGAAYAMSDLHRLEGKPVIAIDSNEASYFKRLRLTGEDEVILESLDASGAFPPVVLSLLEGARRRPTLVYVYPVLGVLFDR